MPSTRIFRRRRRLGRAGFTLVELLTVIGIIAVLIALTVTAVFRFIGVQEKNNTQAALNKLAPLVKSAWTRAIEQAKADNSPQYQTNAFVQQYGGGNAQRQRVLWVYLRLQQAFPMSFNEVFNPLPGALPGLPSYVSYLTQLGVTAANASSFDQQQPNFTNAACLLMALQRRESSGGITADDLGKASTNLFPLPNGQISALVDGWDTPLYFIRWPTGFQALNTGGPQPGVTNDPLDPLGLLESSTWINTSASSTFQALFHPLPSTTGLSYKILPVIVSAGPDKQLGLDGFGDVLNAFANDNLDSVTTQP